MVSKDFGSILKELLKPCTKRETKELHECTDICFLHPIIMDGEFGWKSGRILIEETLCFSNNFNCKFTFLPISKTPFLHFYLTQLSSKD